jgi:hypothetical protein
MNRLIVFAVGLLKKSSHHDLPQRPVDSIQIDNNSSPLASQAALYLVSFPFLTISAARPGLHAAQRVQTQLPGLGM